jgi:hypothetical protein
MKIVALILRHELTILIPCTLGKSRNGSIAQNRNHAHDIERNAEISESNPASAISWRLEIVRKA